MNVQPARLSKLISADCCYIKDPLYSKNVFLLCLCPLKCILTYSCPKFVTSGGDVCAHPKNLRFVWENHVKDNALLRVHE